MIFITMKVKQLLQFLQDNPDLYDHNIEIQQLVMEQGRNPIPYFLKSVDDIKVDDKRVILTHTVNLTNNSN